MTVFVATDEQRHSVELLAGIGIRQKEIALAIGISMPTLRKHFPVELKTGKVRIIGRIADSLVRQALAGNMTAAIFFLKTQARWSEYGAGSGFERPGKKELQNQAAEKVGGVFATPAGPKLAVNNG